MAMEYLDGPPKKSAAGVFPRLRAFFKQFFFCVYVPEADYFQIIKQALFAEDTISLLQSLRFQNFCSHAKCSKSFACKQNDENCNVHYRDLA